MGRVQVDGDDAIRRSDIDALIVRVGALLARVSAGEVAAGPGFEQRVFGGLVALEVVASDEPLTVRTLVERWADIAPAGRP